MTPEDQAAFDRAVRGHCDYWDFTTKDVFYMRNGFEAGLNHRDAQIKSADAVRKLPRLTDDRIREIDEQTPGGLIEFTHAIIDAIEAKMKEQQ